MPAIDVPFLDLTSPAGLAVETQRARALGFTAKAAIHPSQIEEIHRAFLPTTEEIVAAQAAVAAYRGAGGGVAMFNGKMIDTPVVRHYERILALGSATRE
jgi:citrate lyase beta subunit